MFIKNTKIISYISMKHLPYFYYILSIWLIAKPKAHLILIWVNIFGFQFVIPIRSFGINNKKYELSLDKNHKKPQI